MEELALFVLPRIQDFDDDSASGNELDNSSIVSSLSQQRSVSDASRDVTLLEEGEEYPMHLDNLETNEQLVVGTEVFYRYPKTALNVEGAGIQCIIKKVWLNKKPYVASSSCAQVIANTLIKGCI
jgi:hypothetical protein